MKLIIVGGHFSPALSVIESLKKSDEIFYIGRKTTFEGDKAQALEYKEIQSRNIPFFSISGSRLQRKITRFTLFSLSKLPISIFQSLNILKRIKPDVVLSFGGYLSIPVAVSAKILGIPVVIHEQTLEAGFANKFIARFANKVLISWESSRKFFPKEKTVLTGNPLTKEIIEIKKSEPQKNMKNTIYITGGSSGAHFINVLVEASFEKLLENFNIVHQTGDSKKFNDYDRILDKKENLKEDLKKNYLLKKFLSPKESAKAIKFSDLIIGRAGINTISELIYLEKPAILIPLPFGQKNEQQKNAIFIKELGLAEVLMQENLTSEIFIEKIFSVFKNINNYKLKKQVLQSNAAEKITAIVRNVPKKKTT